MNKGDTVYQVECLGDSKGIDFYIILSRKLDSFGKKYMTFFAETIEARENDSVFEKRLPSSCFGASIFATIDDAKLLLVNRYKLKGKYNLAETIFSDQNKEWYYYSKSIPN